MSFEFFVDNACFLCLDHQLRDHPSKEACQNTHIEIKCESNSISRVNIEIESKFEKSEEMFIEHKFDMTSINRSCYFRMIPIMQWTKFRVEINENEDESKAYDILYRNILLGMFTYVVPLVLLFALNWLIYKHLRGRRKVIKELGKNKVEVDLFEINKDLNRSFVHYSLMMISNIVRPRCPFQ